MVGHRRRLALPIGALATAVAFLVAFVAWPLWEVAVAAARREPTGIPLNAWHPFLTTLRLAVGGVILAFVIGMPAAWALYRVPWRGRHAVRALATVPFVLPTVVVGAAFVALLGPTGLWGRFEWERSEWAIVLALAFYNVAIVVRVVGAAWEALDPQLETAARSLGAGGWRTLAHVTLPLLRNAMASAASLVFLFCATAFGVVLVLGGGSVRTLETEIYTKVSQLLDLRAAALLSLLQLAIAALVIALTARRRASTAPLASVSAPGRVALSRRTRLTVAAALVPLAVLQIPPVVALVERSLRTPHGHGLDHYRAVVAGTDAGTPDFVAAAANSLVLASLAALVSMVVAGCIAFAAARGAGGRWLDGLFLISIGVSAVTLGLGYLVGLRPVFGSSALLLIIAQAVIALPLAARTLVPTVRSLDSRRAAAAATLGANPWQRLVHIWLPHMKGAFIVAVALAFAVALGEFGAATFLARPDAPTIPVVIARSLSRPGPDAVGMGFAGAVALGAMVAAISLAAERLRSRTGVTGW